MLTGFTYIQDKYSWLAGAFDDLKTATGTTATVIVDDEGKLGSISTGVYSAIEPVFNGGASTIPDGQAVDVEVPWNCEIESVTMLATTVGSISVAITKSTYAGYPPATTIYGAAMPQIVTNDHSQDLVLSGWTTSLSQGDILRFVTGLNSGITQLTCSLKVRKV